MRRTLLILAVLLAVAAGCSDSDDGTTSDTNSGDTADTTASDTGGTGSDTGTDTTTGGVTSGDADTAGLKDFLDESYPDEGYSSEISIMTIGESTVLVNLQTSFFEPDEAVALCEAVVAYLDGAGVTGPVEFVSTSGSDVAMRTSPDSGCEPGADL